MGRECMCISTCVQGNEIDNYGDPFQPLANKILLWFENGYGLYHIF